MTDNAQICIRAAQRGDLAAIARIEARTELASLIEPDSETVHSKRFSGSNAFYRVAERDGEITGYAILQRDPSATDVIELKRIVAQPPGLGIGSVMMRAVLIEVFGDWEAASVWLDTVRSNARAHRAYQKVGFRRSEIIKNGFKGPQGYEDLFVFTLDRSFFKTLNAAPTKSSK